MSFELFKTTLKRNWLLLVIFFGVLTMYITVMISMYDPDNMGAILSMVRLFPKSLMSAMGFSDIFTDFTGYLASWLYGLLMLAFPMVYCIILGNRLVAKLVDNGSFAYLLSTPTSRVKIIVTQGLYALLSVLLLSAALFGVGVLSSAAMHPGLLNVRAFFRLNATTMLVNMAVMMIAFFFSCLFNESKTAIGFGAGIPVVFLLLNMLGGMSPQARLLKEISIYGFYSPVRLAEGEAVWMQNLAYIGIIAVLFVGGTLIFRRKRLPL